MTRKRKRKPEWERFIALIKVEELATCEALGPCHLWQGAITSSGHGCFRVWRDGKLKTISAHKYSYLHYHGPLSDPRFEVRHMCDVRPCVNPDHLCEGTRKDNVHDMMERNRGRMQFGTEERKEKDECPF